MNAKTKRLDDKRKRKLLSNKKKRRSDQAMGKLRVEKRSGCKRVKGWMCHELSPESKMSGMKH
jgi:hypothetical protein